MMTTLNIFDGHNDTLLHLLQNRRSFFERSSEGAIDLPRAREGGLTGAFFAVYVPSENRPAPSSIDEMRQYLATVSDATHMPLPLDIGYAQRLTMSMVAGLFRIEAQSGGRVRVVRSADDLDVCLKEGSLAAVLHFEGAEAIDPGLDALEVFHQAGLRSLGIVHSRPNLFGHGVPITFNHSPDAGPGLSDAGRELVRACNRLGVMLDLSHLNEQGFWDVAGLSEAPLVATHSNAYTLSPSARNLTDRQLDAIRASDGMVGLNFHVGFLRADGELEPDTPLDTLVSHTDYLVEHLGIDRVGFGSDYEYAVVPTELRDVTALPKLVDALRQRGYDEAALRKLTHENWLRVLRRTWGA
jgi:membrane dipeptidase